MSIRFHLNGELNQESSISPSTTVLDYLRLVQMVTGTKEGCAEGDCGACSIGLHSLDDNNKPTIGCVAISKKNLLKILPLINKITKILFG